ncbi:hypothetical protein E5288_WYG014821 [Bos mutus]|uniref:Uncharacterized protein n=1 Tax=Bos mutus TaxID=72004 RepID=A0A6B0S4Y2_9CETA|nr:hypothetical protein [Bos mutus]
MTDLEAEKRKYWVNQDFPGEVPQGKLISDIGLLLKSPPCRKMSKYKTSKDVDLARILLLIQEQLNYEDFKNRGSKSSAVENELADDRYNLLIEQLQGDCVGLKSNCGRIYPHGDHMSQCSENSQERMANTDNLQGVSFCGDS